MKRTTQFLAAAGSILAATAFSTLPATAQRIDPDPDIFDGNVVGRGTGGGIKIDPSIDLGNWEESSVVVFDPNGENPQPFSVGMQGPQLPGMQRQQQGMQGGGGQQGMQFPGIGIPLPSGGEGNSDQSVSGSQSMSSAKGGQEGQTPPPGMEGSTGEAEGNSGTPPPENVAIGDPDNAIQSEGPPPVDGTPMTDPAGTESANGRSSTDRTKMPSASGAQTGRRGGDPEKGDAVPTDL